MWQPTTDRQRWYSLAIITLVLMAIAAGALYGANTADAEASVEFGAFDIADHDETIDGDVSDVDVAATLDYQTDVPDAERRLIYLRAGPTDGEMETLDFVQQTVNGDPETGTVTLDGSLLDHPELDAKAFGPTVADSETTEIDVQAELEVRRENGETVTHVVEDTVTITLTDDSELTAELGGSGDIIVTTDA